MLREIKNGGWHYFVDGLGRIQGEVKSWYSSGVLWDHRYYVDGKLHGECKAWYKNGVLREHYYWDNDDLVHDFLVKPLTDVEKMLLVLKYGGKLLPRGGIC